MKFVTFSELNGSARAGLLVDGAVIDLLSIGYANVLDIIVGGAASSRKIEDAVATLPEIPLDKVRLHAPLPNPPRIFCVGLNYRDHAIESKMEIPKVPTIFLKLPSAVIGPQASIELPSISAQPDYEAEFAIVVGKQGSKIPRDKWEDYIFGYTILNDISARDIQLATTQWTLGKSFDTFCPIGPAIVTSDEIADPHELDIKLSIDGEVLQHSNTRELIFKAPDLLAYVSSITTLQPGDIISTGTPHGVGLGRTPNRWLKPGETVRVEIEGIGTLVNPVIAGA
jgi:2-keto-4-pentenoate hydratase/2-oxohepta-3-ene-1,7-dioic acid hydratase in catechol pathway